MTSLWKGWEQVRVMGNFVGLVTLDMGPKLKEVCGMCCNDLNLGVFFLEKN